MRTTVGMLSLAVILTLGSVDETAAQSNWEAGIRFGDNVSADLTMPIAKAPRLQTAVYFDRFGVGGYLDWLFALSDGPAALKFYPGFGPELFFEDRFDFHVAGNFGVEYSFDFPLTLGLDWRPTIRLTNGSDYHGGNWGVTARYRFGEGAFVRAD